VFNSTVWRPSGATEVTPFFGARPRGYRMSRVVGESVCLTFAVHLPLRAGSFQNASVEITHAFGRFFTSRVYSAYPATFLPHTFTGTPSFNDRNPHPFSCASDERPLHFFLAPHQNRQSQPPLSVQVAINEAIGVPRERLRCWSKSFFAVLRPSGPPKGEIPSPFLGGIVVERFANVFSFQILPPISFP